MHIRIRRHPRVPPTLPGPHLEPYGVLLERLELTRRRSRATYERVMREVR